MPTPDADPPVDVAQPRIDLRQLLGILVGVASLLALAVRASRPHDAREFIVTGVGLGGVLIAAAAGLAAGVWTVTTRRPGWLRTALVALVVANAVAAGVVAEPAGWMILITVAGVALVANLAAWWAWRLTPWDCLCVIGFGTLVAWVVLVILGGMAAIVLVLGQR